MTEMLRDLQDALLTLGERVDELEAAQGQAATETRRLAVSVVEMGDALARRVKALEHGPPPAPPLPQPLFISPVTRPPKPPAERPLSWSVGLGFALAGILGAFWFLRSEISDQPLAAANTTAAPVVTPTIIPVVTAPPHGGAGVKASHKPSPKPKAVSESLGGHELYSPDTGTSPGPPPS